MDKHKKSEKSVYEAKYSTFVHEWLLVARLQDIRMIPSRSTNFLMQTEELGFDENHVKGCSFKIYALVDDRSDVCICVKFAMAESNLPGNSGVSRYSHAHASINGLTVEFYFRDNDEESARIARKRFIRTTLADVPLELSRKIKDTGESGLGNEEWWYASIVLGKKGWRANILYFDFDYTALYWSTTPDPKVAKISMELAPKNPAQLTEGGSGISNAEITTNENVELAPEKTEYTLCDHLLKWLTLKENSECTEGSNPPKSETTNENVNFAANLSQCTCGDEATDSNIAKEGVECVASCNTETLEMNGTVPSNVSAGNVKCGTNDIPVTVKGAEVPESNIDKEFEFINHPECAFEWSGAAKSMNFKENVEFSANENFGSPSDEKPSECDSDLTPYLLDDLVPNNETCDAVMYSSGRQLSIRVHIRVLEERSPVLKEICVGTHGKIEVEDCHPEALEQFVQFLYTGEADFNNYSKELHNISVRYRIKSLKEKCEKEQQNASKEKKADHVEETVVAARLELERCKALLQKLDTWETLNIKESGPRRRF